MSENTFGQAIIQKIKQQALKPKPRWQFLLKDYFVWAVGITAVLIGGFAVAVILHMLVNSGWSIYQNMSGDLTKFVLATLPYFWLIFLGLFILVANYNIKHTKKGYRLSIVKLTLIIIVVSLIFGSFFYSIGLGQYLDYSLTDRMPFYRSLLRHRTDLWLKPEQGFLAGIITEIDSKYNFQLLDIDRMLWEVKADKNALMKQFNLEPGLHIKMIGEVTSPHEFEALRIMPDMSNPPQFFKKGLLRPPLPKPIH